jgi:cell division protein ZapA
MENVPSQRQQVKVNILNQSFTLVTEGDPQEMVDLANQVEELMMSIARRSPNLDSTRVAVFACLHLADQLRVRQADINSRAKKLELLLDEVLKGTG